MQDAWRAYLELALGLTEASKKKARKAAMKLVGQSGATAAQLQGMAEELFSTGLANREALVKIIRFEVDRALGKVGLATAEEVADLNSRVSELQRKLREAEERLAGQDVGAAARPPAGAPPATDPAGPTGADAATVPTQQPAAGTAVAKRTVAKKAVAKKTVAKKTVAKKAVAKKAVATKAVAGSAATDPARDEPAKQTGKKTAARRSAGGRSGPEEETP